MRRSLLPLLLVAACGGPATSAAPSANTAGAALADAAKHASIAADPGTQLLLCGRADRQAMNQWLQDAGEAFDASLPDSIPDPYWGIRKASDSYVCIGARHSDHSVWGLGNSAHLGPFSLFDVQVFGFRLDTHGQRVDVTGDGLVDESDWLGLEIGPELSGASGGDGAFYSDFYHRVFGAKARPAEITIELGGDGYPDALTLNEGDFVGHIGNDNPNRCAPSNASWEQCWYYEAYSGDMWETYASPRALVAHWTFANSQNNWLTYDATHDTFAVGDEALAQALTQVSFAPQFWVRANQTHFDYTSP